MRCRCPYMTYSRLSLSRIPRDSEILRDIRTSTYQICRIEEKLIRTTTLTKMYVIRFLKLKIYWKYCGKEEKLLLRSNFSSFPQYFYLSSDFYVQTGTIFLLRDKRLFEISEVEIARVNCMYLFYVTHSCSLHIRTENNFMWICFKV